MNTKKIFLAVAMVATALPTFAQYAADAFLFSGATNSATARFNALGGSQTALGGDLSSLYGNPAGLGMFTKSEFNFTPSYNININETGFLGNNITQNSNHINLNNMGLVINSPIATTGSTTQGVLAFNFGIGYQKTNLFKNEMNLGGGVAFENGISDYLSESANNEKVLYADLNNVSKAGYDGYLFEDNGATLRDYNPLTTKDSKQQLRLNRKGNQSNFDVSMGVNVSNALYLGATIGFASINFRSNNDLTEQGITIVKDNLGVNRPYNYNAKFTNNYDTQGSGVNLKLGAIFKPVYEFRIGATIETPTWYSVTDVFTQTLNMRDINNIPRNGQDVYNFDYTLSTPLKMSAGLSYFMGKRGFLTANINYIGHSDIRFRSNDAVTTSKVMGTLQDSYQDVENYNFGTEIKIVDNFSLRAGYTILGNPYRNRKFKSEQYSGGMGYKFGNYYIDGALILITTDATTQYKSYELDFIPPPVATITTNRAMVSVTFGARF